MAATVSILILCEDLQAQVFILDALDALDLRQRVRVIPFPGRIARVDRGSGAHTVDGYVIYPCGSQHVRENYPRLLRERRQGQARLRKTGCRLIVHMDVDNTAQTDRTVDDRRRELQAACAQQLVPTLTADEPVAHLIPRRNIETWLQFFLAGPPIDEATAYPYLSRQSDAQPAAQSFAQHAQAGTQPAAAPPSLVSGLAEFRRVL